MNIVEKTVYEIDSDGIQYPTLRHAQEELLVRMLANHAAKKCSFYCRNNYDEPAYADARSIAEYIAKNYKEIMEIINDN